MKNTNLGLGRRAFLSSGVAALAAAKVACGGEADAGSAKTVDPAKTVGEFDVCVVGGSCTGVFAAVRAAEAGMRVAIIERNYYFGGTATAGFVPIWHSLFSLDGSRRIVGGLTQRVIDRLVARGLATLNDPKGGKSESVYCNLNTAALQEELDRMVQRSGVRAFLGADFVTAETDRPGHVTRAVIEDKSGRRAIAARFFIDCSGDADLVARAGFETWKPPREALQAHTLCALVTGVERLRKAHPDFSFSEVMKPSRGAKLNHVFQWEAPVPGCPEATFLAATRVSACDPTDADDLTCGMFEARAQLKRIVDAANRAFPTDGPGLHVAAVAPQLGLRESRHLCGLYRVTGQDVLSGREFPDVIAKGTYRVDIHEGKGIKFRYLDGREWEMLQDLKTGEIQTRHGRWRPEGTDPECYQVPYRAIVPKGSENVLAAGRMLDADREAYGALRVMVNCNQMGEAAGCAAAKAVKEHLAAADAYPGFVSSPA